MPIDILNIIYLCSCAVQGNVPTQDNIEKLNLEELYLEARRHMLAAMVGQVLQDVGASTVAFSEIVGTTYRKAVIMKNELSQVKSALEEAGIWYMPLKGSVIQDLYPRFGMREMADFDILIDPEREADVKAIMEKQGFETIIYNKNNHDVFQKSPVSCFEMHTALFGDKEDPKLVSYYKDVKSRLVKDKDNLFGYHFMPEDFYIFMIAHEYKHYSHRGIGLRPLVDTYIILHKYLLDMNYVAEETEKLGIKAFEEQNRSLVMNLFSGDELTVDNRKMLDYMIASGAQGSIIHKIENEMKRLGESKFRYLLRRFAGPINDKDKNYKEIYGLFFKVPILYPLLPFYRLLRRLRKSPRYLWVEIKALWKAKRDT